MQTFKNVLSAIIGYAGSSEDPQKMSLRFYGVAVGVSSQVMPFIILIGARFMSLPEGVTPEQASASVTPLLQLVCYALASVLWSVGLIRAIHSAVKTKNLGALYGLPKKEIVVE